MSVIIQLTEPTSRDAVIASPAKDFAQAYILDLTVNAAEASGNDYISINYCPFDQESGERLIEDSRNVTVPFWQTIEAFPEAALAFKAVGDALPVLIAHQKQELEDMLAAEQLAEAEFAAAEAAANETLAEEAPVVDDTVV